MNEPQKFSLAVSHPARFPLAPFMIVPQQVKQSVDQQPVDFPPDRLSRFARLTLGDGKGNHDVPEHMALDQAERSLPKGEGEHVRGPVLAAIAPVQGPHGPVPDKQNAQFRVRQSQGAQKLLKARPYIPLR